MWYVNTAYLRSVGVPLLLTLAQTAQIRTSTLSSRSSSPSVYSLHHMPARMRFWDLDSSMYSSAVTEPASDTIIASPCVYFVLLVGVFVATGTVLAAGVGLCLGLASPPVFGVVLVLVLTGLARDFEVDAGVLELERDDRERVDDGEVTEAASSSPLATLSTSDVGMFSYDLPHLFAQWSADSASVVLLDTLSVSAMRQWFHLGSCETMCGSGGWVACGVSTSVVCM